MEAEVRDAGGIRVGDTQNGGRPEFLEYPELSARKIGGKIHGTSSDVGNTVESLLKDCKPVWKESRMRAAEEEPMDGWLSVGETRPSWCIVKLGVPGILRGIEVDTSYFVADHARKISLEGADLESDLISPDTKWEELLPPTCLEPGYLSCCHNYFTLTSQHPWSHVRLNVLAGNGIARIHVFGEPRPNLSRVTPDQLLDLLSVRNGGLCVGASCPEMRRLATSLHLPTPTPTDDDDDGDGGNGGNGGGGHSTFQRVSRQNALLPVSECETIFKTGKCQEVWAIFRLAYPGSVTKVEVNSGKFRTKFPAFLTIDACSTSAEHERSLEEWSKVPVAGSESGKVSPWHVLVPTTGILPCTAHTIEMASNVVTSHVRLRLQMLNPSSSSSSSAAAELPLPTVAIERCLEGVLDSVHIWGQGSTRLRARL
ncbi:allantoicase-like [Argonauta hians]